ncbi:MAG: hypothetical protein ACFFDT_28660 [Candidatus Hodarchaeota archaeon]
MLITNKASVCHYYSAKGTCTVLKINRVKCPRGCSFFYVKDEKSILSSDIIEECRFLQLKELYTICCKKGEFVSSCGGCQDYDVIENSDSYPSYIESLFQALDSSLDIDDDEYREVDTKVNPF